eukprot:12948-Heterococcus_DN1.PRE.2
MQCAVRWCAQVCVAHTVSAVACCYEMTCGAHYASSHGSLDAAAFRPIDNASNCRLVLGHDRSQRENSSASTMRGASRRINHTSNPSTAGRDCYVTAEHFFQLLLLLWTYTLLRNNIAAVATVTAATAAAATTDCFKSVCVCCSSSSSSAVGGCVDRLWLHGLITDNWLVW